MADPVGERGSIQTDALPGIDLGLAVQWQVVGILRHQDLGNGGFRRQAAFDQTRGRRSLHHTIFATPAGVFGPPGDEYPQLGRCNVQPLAFVLADLVQIALAAATGRVADIDDDLEPRQVRRRQATVGAALCSPCGSLGRSQLIRCRRIARRRLLDDFKAEQHLIFGKGLSPAAKTVALQFLNDLAQPLVLHPLGEQHRLQRLEIIRQRVAWHDRSRSD
jgi:hypothetical protein